MHFFHKWTLAALAVIGWWCASGCQSTDQKSWQAVQSAGPIGDDPTGHVLAQLYNQCNAAFWATLPAEHTDEYLTWYVGQFGKHGADADIRWMLADPDAFIATAHAIPSGLPSKERQDSYRLALGVLHVDGLAAEALVKRFLKEPAIVPRYYRAVVWFGQLLDDKARYGYAIGKLTQHFQDSQGPPFWLFARQFILLAHATGRDDLWLGKKPEDLKPAFVEWRTWFLGSTGKSSAPALDAAAAYMQLSPDKLCWQRRPGLIPASLAGLPRLDKPDRPLPEGTVPIRAGVILSVMGADAVPSYLSEGRAIGSKVGAEEAAEFERASDRLGAPSTEK